MSRSPNEPAQDGVINNKSVPKKSSEGQGGAAVSANTANISADAVRMREYRRKQKYPVSMALVEGAITASPGCSAITLTFANPVPDVDVWRSMFHRFAENLAYHDMAPWCLGIPHSPRQDEFASTGKLRRKGIHGDIHVIAPLHPHAVMRLDAIGGNGKSGVLQNTRIAKLQPSGKSLADFATQAGFGMIVHWQRADTNYAKYVFGPNSVACKVWRSGTAPPNDSVGITVPKSVTSKPAGNTDRAADSSSDVTVQEHGEALDASLPTPTNIGDYKEMKTMGNKHLQQYRKMDQAEAAGEFDKRLKITSTEAMMDNVAEGAMKLTGNRIDPTGQYRGHMLTVHPPQQVELRKILGTIDPDKPRAGLARWVRFVHEPVINRAFRELRREIEAGRFTVGRYYDYAAAFAILYEYGKRRYFDTPLEGFAYGNRIDPDAAHEGHDGYPQPMQASWRDCMQFLTRQESIRHTYAA